MIYQLFIFALILLFGGILLYPLRVMTTTMIALAEANAPAYVTGTAVDFIKAVDYWLPLLAVILPGMLWFFVNIQRPKHEEVY